ncbi:MAG: ketopantoate reductase family protein [Candidatus Thorarchaeota archaeon]
MKLAVIGAGSIGSIIIANMARAGKTVHVVDKVPETIQSIKDNGISICGARGEFTVKENLIPISKIEDLPKDIDVVFLITKIDNALDAVNRLRTTLKENFTLVNFTNGMIEEKIAEILPPENILGCVISFNAMWRGYGKSERTNEGEIVLGRLKGKKREFDEEILQLISHSAKTSWSDDIIANKFSKLLINITMASTGAFSGLAVGELLKRKAVRIAFLINTTEGIKIAHKIGLKLPKLNNLRFESLALLKKQRKILPFGLWLKMFIIQIIGKQNKNLRSANLGFYERGLPTEIPYMNGYIVELGKKHGIQTPLNEFIANLVQKIDDGKSKPSLENLKLFEEKTMEIFNQYYC